MGGKLTVIAENVACSALQSDAMAMAAVALSGCSGSGVPDVSDPRCYKGTQSVLGLGETLEITLEDFDTSSNSGHMHLQGSGATGFSCSRHSFSKSGQAITTDLSDCLPHKVEVTGVEYCSDSDEIQVSVNDKNIPWGMVKLTVTAENVACSALASSQQQSLLVV